MYSIEDIQKDLLEVEDYYSNLLLNQYQKIKAQKTIRLLSREAFSDFLIKNVFDEI